MYKPQRGQGVVAALLNSYVPEFATYLRSEGVDLFFVPNGHEWDLAPRGNVIEASLSSHLAAVLECWSRLCGEARAKARIESSRWLAEAYARRMSEGIDRLIIDQDLLPHLWSAGWLRGKKFEVLLTRPPLARLNQSFDHALEFHPSASSLREYRAPVEIATAEEEALAACDCVVTAHSEYATLFPRVRRLQWQVLANGAHGGDRAPRQKKLLLFPASLAVREGALSALAAAEDIGLPLFVTGHDRDELASHFPDTVIFKGRLEIPWNSVAAVVHPTLLEPWPRLHLEAAAHGIPVIGTRACGVAGAIGFHGVPFGEVEPVIENALLVLKERRTGERQRAAREGREGWPSYEPPRGIIP